MARPDVLRGPLGRTIAALAGPVIAAEAVHTAFHIVDVFWVGRLGAYATGAIMTSMFTLWTAFSLSNLVNTGLSAQVSRAVGAGNRAHAGHAVAQALYLNVALSLVVALLGATMAPALFSVLGTDAQLSAAGTSYLATIMLGSPFAFLYLMGGAVMRSCGNTRTPMWITGAALVCNGALAPVLIYGLGPAPALGVMGSAVATNVCMAGATAAYGALLWRGHADLPLERASLRRIDGAMLRALARVGAPQAAVGSIFSLVYLVYTRLAAPFGAAAVAVIGVANRLESINYLTSDGFAVATSTFVGQNLGAGNPGRAARGAWRAASIMAVVGAALSVVFFLFPRALLMVFTRDPQALAIGVPYVRVLALCQIATAVEGVIGGGFAGAGDTVPPMAVHVSFAILRLPLAVWAVRFAGMGIMGIAWTMTLTCLVRGAILALVFRRGTWMKKELPGALGLTPIAAPPDVIEA